MSQPTPEAQTIQPADVAAQLEGVVQQDINMERFEAVPEHDGSIQRLIERYGDNPGTCPFIKSMGEAGVELVQKLAKAESNTERGPTMRELMEAKKRQAQASETAANKPAPTSGVDTSHAKAAQHRPDIKPNVIEVKVNDSEALIARRHVSKIIEEVLGVENAAATKEVAPAHTPRQPNEQYQHRNVNPKPETTTARQGVDLDISRPIKIEGTYQVQRIAEAVNAAQASVPVESSAGIDPPSVSAEGQDFDSEAPLAELGLQDPLLEVSNDIQVVEQPAEAAFMEPEVGTEPFLPDSNPNTGASAVVTVPEESLTNIMHPEEAVIPIELQEELSAYMQLLEPSKAEAAQATLEQLVDALQNIHEPAEQKTSEKILTTEEIKQLFTQLLEPLGLDYSSVAVTQILQSMLTPEVVEGPKQQDRLTIDQLNYMGTHEYKSNSILSMFISLLQMIKAKIGTHVRIGKYTLSASFV